MELFWVGFRNAGVARFGWFSTLKNSARNCALNASETFFMRKFLKTEKSTVASLGPYTLLRPELPRRFVQVPGIPGLPGSAAAGLGILKPNGSHWAAISGVATGRAKQ